MTEEDRLRKHVRVLETQMYYKEKELLRVYRELDRFRRKCELWKLRAKRRGEAAECGMQTEKEVAVTPQTVVAEPQAPVPQTPTPAPTPAAKPKTRKTTIGRLLSSLQAKPASEEKSVPEAKPVTEAEVESSPVPPPPQKRKAAYMQPYAPVKFQSSYTPTHLQAPSNTPLYESLQRKESASVRWREHFQMLKVMYLSKETFGLQDVQTLQESLRDQDPDPIATFLVQEIAEAADTLHFADAMEIAIACTKGTIGRNSVWDQTFLKSLRALATDSMAQKRFFGRRQKMPSEISAPESGNLLQFIVIWHTTICLSVKDQNSHRDFLVTLMSRGNRDAAKCGFSLWSDSRLFSLKVIGDILADRTESLMQEVAVRVSVSSVTDESDIYKAVKVMYRSIPPDEAYQLYSCHLWNVFAASFPDSVARKVVVKSLGALMQVLEKAGKLNTLKLLQDCLKEAAADKTHQAFSDGELKAAAHSLRKAARPSHS